MPCKNRVARFCVFALSVVYQPALYSEDGIPSFGEREDETENTNGAIAVSGGVAYTDYRWHPAPHETFATPPVLESHESVSVNSGVAYAEKKVFWITRDTSQGNSSFALLAWNSSSGKTERSAVLRENIRGMIWDAEKHLLLVRLRDKMLWYDTDSLSEIKRMPFVKLAQEWRDLAFIGNGLIVLSGSGDKLDIYDKNDLTFRKSVSTGALKLQRMWAFEGNTLLLWSSYWGAKLRTFDLNTASETGILHATFSYKAFRKAAFIAPGRIGLFDISDSNTWGEAVRSGFSLVNLHDGAEVDNSGLAYRFAPVKQTIRAVLKIQPQQDTGEAFVVVNLPHITTYSQQITAETSTGEIVTDVYGNRYALAKIPALAKGHPQEIELYRAEIIRYQASFDILAAAPVLKAGGEFERYLTDHAILQLGDPFVMETQKKVMAGLTVYTEKIVAAHAFGMSIKPLWDGKNEPVPAVLRNMHGGCNEHTRVIVAFLRLKKFPRVMPGTISGRGLAKRNSPRIMPLPKPG